MYTVHTLHNPNTTVHAQSKVSQFDVLTTIGYRVVAPFTQPDITADSGRQYEPVKHNGDNETEGATGADICHDDRQSHLEILSSINFTIPLEVKLYIQY